MKLNPAAGCGCCTNLCGCSVPSTIHASHSIFGAFTLTAFGVGYQGSIVYSYPGFGGCCPPTTVPITLLVTNQPLYGVQVCVAQFTYPGSVVPPNDTPCPLGGFGITVQKGSILKSIQCTPFIATFNFPAEPNDCFLVNSPTFWGNLTLGMDSTLTVTL